MPQLHDKAIAAIKDGRFKKNVKAAPTVSMRIMEDLAGSAGNPLTVTQFEPLVLKNLLEKFTGSKVVDALLRKPLRNKNYALGRGYFLDKEGDLYDVLDNYHEDILEEAGLLRIPLEDTLNDSFNKNWVNTLRENNLVRLRQGMGAVNDFNIEAASKLSDVQLEKLIDYFSLGKPSSIATTTWPMRANPILGIFSDETLFRNAQQDVVTKVIDYLYKLYR